MTTNETYKIMTFFIVLIGLNVATIHLAKADSKTIFVPDDYPTIAAAVANASDGDTIFVKNGTYNEPSLLIDKSIKLIGEDKNSTVIIFHPNPYNVTFDHGPFGVPITLTFWNDILDITAPNITLSGFTIKCLNSKGGDISLTGNGTQVVNNKIDWSIRGTGNRIQILNNTFSGDASIVLSGSNLTIAQNIVSEAIYCSGSYSVIVSNQVRKTDQAIYMDDDIHGPWFSISVGSFGIVVDNCINAGGLALNGNGSVAAMNKVRSSVWVNGSDHTVCANNVTHGGLIITGNNNKFYANNITGYINPRLHEQYKVKLDRIQGAPYALSIGRNYEAFLYNVSARNYANNTFYHNNFNCNTQVRLWDGVVGPNFWSNADQGNYWNDYNGTDVNQDGIGDTPYTIDIRNPDYLPLSNTYIQDPYPLMVPFSTDGESVELPELTREKLRSLPDLLQGPAQETQPKPFPTLPVAVLASASAVAVGVGILVYFKKHRH